MQNPEDSHACAELEIREMKREEGKEEVRGRREAEVQIWTRGGQKKEPAASVPGGGTLGMAGRDTGGIRSRKLFSCIRLCISS